MIKTDYIQNPGEGTKYLVQKYNDILVETILKDTSAFDLKPHLKAKSLQQLYTLIICVEDGIKPHVEKILRSIVYKLILDEEPDISSRAYKIAELIGLYVQTDYVLPMMISHLTDTESKSVPRFVSSCLTAFSAVLIHSSVRFSDQLQSFMANLIKLIVSSDFLQSDNVDVLDRTLRVTANLIHTAGPLCKQHQHSLFKILLQLGSIPNMASHRAAVDETLHKLAKNCGLDEGGDLFSVELSELIEEMQESYENWDKHTPERFIFDLLVRRANTALIDKFEDILQIIAANVENDKEYELRMDMLALVEFLLQAEQLQSNIVFYSQIVLKMILIPSTQWKVGKPNIKIRKAAVICMIRLLEFKLIDKEKLYSSFKDIMNVLKNCIDDDWANDLRFASVVLIKKMIEYMNEVFDEEDYKEIYPELLKRLDDSQDSIRIETANTFKVFFTYLPDPWSSSLYEYTVKNIFIHLDDQNQEIQTAIMRVLELAARVQTDKFLEIANDQMQKFSHPVLCKNLIEYVKETYKK
ncbi:heat repeat-containing protein 2 [Stylonychia lemnae]|uniref:Heat repeat-containing protein 2 n=1 Tax=Stylonychia lemnae TaxID=5949 RepID=A0A078A5D5_STYLE|nr:heat repeat-containing protein 2 [Stylonychia lemnae]|eukprot:CDW75974.1 heat repeat-containing protein 2 [Stylonychia lemnae]